METFGQVTEKADRVLIVASGPSAEDLDLSLVSQARDVGVYILVVNGAWEWCRHINGWFTLDPDRKLFKYLFNKNATIQRYAAVPDDYGNESAVVQYHRNMPFLVNVIYLHRLTGSGRMGSRYGLSDDPGSVNTGNSAYGAMGVAMHMGANKIGLIGVDGDRNLGYANLPGCPKYSLYHLPGLFQSAADQLKAAGITVRNGSPKSRITCFDRYHPDDVVKWLMASSS